MAFLADLGMHIGFDFGTFWAWEGEQGRTGKQVNMSTALKRNSKIHDADEDDDEDDKDTDDDDVDHNAEGDDKKSKKERGAKFSNFGNCFFERRIPQRTDQVP